MGVSSLRDYIMRMQGILVDVQQSHDRHRGLPVPALHIVKQRSATRLHAQSAEDSRSTKFWMADIVRLHTGDKEGVCRAGAGASKAASFKVFRSISMKYTGGVRGKGVRVIGGSADMRVQHLRWTMNISLFFIFRRLYLETYKFTWL
jgi:hypothetical protein